MRKRFRIRMMIAVFALLPMTMAAEGDGDSIIDKIIALGRVACCVGPVCEPDACWIISDCTGDDDCLQ